MLYIILHIKNNILVVQLNVPREDIILLEEMMVVTVMVVVAGMAGCMETLGALVMLPFTVIVDGCMDGQVTMTG